MIIIDSDSHDTIVTNVYVPRPMLLGIMTILPHLFHQMMRSDGLMCDVTLIFGEGSAQRHFKAHKAVLVAVCQTFHMMAQNHTLDNHTSYEIRG